MQAAVKPIRRDARSAHSERGFILLAVFLMAGMVALMLYVQLPRLAFENEREKEQVLIDRGEQFVRAIKLYSKDYNKFPASLKDLEETNNKRYLRRIYVDPYTGKSEWRLVHSNGSQLTDSLVEKPPLEDGATQSSSTTNAQQNQQPQVNAAVAQRPSEQVLPGNQTFLQSPPATQLAQPAAPPGFAGPLPNAIPGFPQVGNPQLVPAGVGQFVPQFAGQQFAGQQFPGQPPPPGVQLERFPSQEAANQAKGLAVPPREPGQVGGQASQFQPQFPGQQFIGQQFAGQPPPPGFQIGPNGQLIPMAPGTPAGAGFAPNQSDAAGAGAPGQPQQNNPGGVVLPPSNTAAQNIVNQLLSGPGGRPATATSGFSSLNNNAAAGIAGVASLHTGPSIKVYKDRTKYEEWEFVYIPTTPLTGVSPGTGGAGGAGPNGRGGPGQPGQPNGPGGLGGFTPSGFGAPGVGPGGRGGQPGQGGRGGQPGPGGRSGAIPFPLVNPGGGATSRSR